MGKPGGGAEDVEDFAAYVRGLKERSERSYGALARRLNVSASTLHRYSSGEAVPADFALLERFAQLCGASPDERTELHRLWVGATEARRTRERASGNPRLPEIREPETRSSDKHEPENDEAESGEPKDHLTENHEPRNHEREQHEPGSHEPEHREPAEPAGPSVVTVGPVASIGGAAPAGSSRRRRRTVAAVAAGAVALVVVALAGLLVPDRGPEPSAPSESPEPVEPLTWTAESHAWQNGCDHRYLVDSPESEVPAPPVEQDAQAWAESLDAVHGQDTLVRITVQGRTSTAVVLEALRVHLVERAAPARGNVFLMNDGCGGALTPRLFDVDLDADRPVARSRAGNDAGTEIPAVTFPYRVSAEDPEILLVNGRTVDCDCSWYLELEWSSQGRSGSVRIDDNGRPFRTSGIDGLPQYLYSWGDERWVLLES